MKKLNEPGAPAVFPKFLKCNNCGCEALVESYEDMEANLPGYSILPPPNPPGIFQFGCPNNCGAAYVAACIECRQKFHYETSITFGGGDDPTHIGFGERKVVEIPPSSIDRLQGKPEAPKRYRFTHKRRPKRRPGGTNGPLP